MRLRVWTRGPKAGERLAAHLLRVDGYTSVDPSHPLGGRDSLKDSTCSKSGQSWIGAAYFPKAPKSFHEIARKFTNDLKGVEINKVDGIVFITNQEIRLRERTKLKLLAKKAKSHLDLFHLERVSQILDTPPCYGLRLEFLGIEMNKEEQVAFFAGHDSLFESFRLQLERVVAAIEDSKSGSDVPLYEITEFKRVLDSISGYGQISTYPGGGHVNALRVPLYELKEFRDILNSISPFAAIHSLKVPLDDIREYEQTLDRISVKLAKVKNLETSKVKI
jgi:hypothetical protein